MPILYCNLNSFTNSVPSDFKRVFIIGQSEDGNVQEKVLAEIDEEKDILFIDTNESYKNMTYKHIAAYEWAISECSNAGNLHKH